MSKEPTNYRVVRELLSFASATDGDLGVLSKEEVKARLQSQGIDTEKLAQATSRKLRTIHNEIAAMRAKEQAEIKSSRHQSSANLGDFPIAARAEGALTDEDQATLARYTQPDIEEDGTED